MHRREFPSEDIMCIGKQISNDRIQCRLLPRLLNETCKTAMSTKELPNSLTPRAATIANGYLQFKNHECLICCNFFFAAI